MGIFGWLDRFTEKVDEPPVIGKGRLLEPTDLALLILRAWLGIVIIAHGANHGRSLDATSSWFEKLGWRRPRLQAMLSSVAEIAIGVGLIAGLLTSVAAAGLIAIMWVAYISNHRPNGFFIFRKGEGYEYVATIAFASLTLAMLGPGAASLDHALGITESNGWTGLAIGLGGIAVGGLQLAAFWKPGKSGEAERRRSGETK